MGAAGARVTTLGGVTEVDGMAVLWVRVCGDGVVVGGGVGAVVGCMDGPFTGSTLGTAPAGSRCTSVCTLGTAPPGEPCRTPVGNP